MGKFRTARGRPAPALDAQDVLSGRVRPGARALVELIRDVNPTGVIDSPEESRARYALKNRLQALLIRRFPSELSLHAEPGQPELLRLEHRGRSACHLRLADLAHDDEARAWARRALDLGPGGGTEEEDRAAAGVAVHAAPASGAPGSIDAALGRGRRLRRDYDYDGARACLQEALDASAGAPGPAQALLGLLIDDLGLDEEALALRGALSPEAEADAEVRLLLGTAAARLGRREEAAALLLGLRRSAAVAAWLHLAARAEADDDMERAEADLAEARAADPAHPEVAALSERLARRRTEAARPEEEAARALLESGDPAEAATRARRILARHPGSVAARQVLRAAENRRSEVRAAALLQEAERTAPASPGRALALLGEALATGVGGALRGRISALRERLAEEGRRAERATRLQHVAALLLGPDARPGLLAYEALPEAERAALRAADLGGAAGRLATLLGWLDELRGARPGAPARAAAEAVLALEAAQGLLAEDPRRALALLAPHERHLEPIRAAGRLQREARARIEARALGAAREAAAARLAEAEGGAGLGDAARLGLLDDIDERLLPEGARQRLRSLRAELADRTALARLGARLGAAAQAGDVNGMRAALAPYAADPRPVLSAHRDEVERQIARRFSLWVCAGPGPQQELGDVALAYQVSDQAARQWLLPGGRELLLARQHQRLCYLRLVGTGALDVRRRALLRLPEGTGELDSVQVEPEGAWLHFSDGTALLIDTGDLRVLLHYEGARLRPAAIQDTEIGPPACGDARVVGGRYLWQSWYLLRPQPRFGQDQCRVFVTDLRDPRHHRPVVQGRALCVAPALQQPLLCGAGSAGPPVSLHGPGGAHLGEVRLPAGLHLVFAAAGPRGGALLLCSQHEPQHLLPAPEARLEGELFVCGLRPDGSLSEPLRIPDSGYELDLGLVPLPSQGLVLLRYQRILLNDERPSNLARLAWLRWEPADPGPPVLVHRQEVARELTLVHASALSDCLALCGGAEGLEALPLRAPPLGGGVLHRPLETCEDPNVVLLCAFELDAGLIALERECAKRVSLQPSAGRMFEAALQFARSQPRRPSGALAAFEALRSHQPELLPALVGELSSGGAGARVWIAHGYAALRRWPDVLRTLSGLGPGDVADPDLRRHLHHLRALGLLWTGDAAGAQADIAACTEKDRCCTMARPLGELTLEAPRLQRFDAREATFCAQARHLRALVTEADARLAAGDPAGAWTLLDETVVWRTQELQAYARMCAAQLQLEWPDEVSRYRQLLLLSTYHHLVHRRSLKALELPYPGHLWPRDRIEALATAASERLDAFAEARAR